MQTITRTLNFPELLKYLKEGPKKVSRIMMRSLIEIDTSLRSERKRQSLHDAHFYDAYGLKISKNHHH